MRRKNQPETASIRLVRKHCRQVRPHLLNPFELYVLTDPIAAAFLRIVANPNGGAVLNLKKN